MVDMGRLQTNVLVARFGRPIPAESGEGGGDGGADEAEASKGEAASKEEQQQQQAAGEVATGYPFSVLKVASDHDLGAFSFDQRMFEHFREQVSCLGRDRRALIRARAFACHRPFSHVQPTRRRPAAHGLDAL